jgi:hypothetical protein
LTTSAEKEQEMMLGGEKRESKSGDQVEDEAPVE